MRENKKVDLETQVYKLEKRLDQMDREWVGVIEENMKDRDTDRMAIKTAGERLKRVGKVERLVNTLANFDGPTLARLQFILTQLQKGRRLVYVDDRENLQLRVLLKRKKPSDIPKGHPPISDLVGVKVGKLKVLCLLPKRGPNRMWECLCECGLKTQRATKDLNKAIRNKTKCFCSHKCKLFRPKKVVPKESRVWSFFGLGK